MFIVSRLEYSTQRYWTGSTWSSIPAQAKKFSSRKAARTEMDAWGVKCVYTITPAK